MQKQLWIIAPIVIVHLGVLQVMAETNRYTLIQPPPGFLKRQKTACINTCDGMGDGNYASCKGCLFFITCSNGFTFTDQSCSWFGGLFWNPRLGLCDWNPNACTADDDNDDKEVKVKKKKRLDCVEDCGEVADGDYQSCRGCNAYLSCADGSMYDDRLCPGGLVWDDIRKYCDWFSHTCRKGAEPVYEGDDVDDELPVPVRYSQSNKITPRRSDSVLYLTSQTQDIRPTVVALTPLQKLLLRGPVR